MGNYRIAVHYVNILTLDFKTSSTLKRICVIDSIVEDRWICDTVNFT